MTAFVRRGLLAVLVLGMVGTGLELLLLKHTEDFWQISPIAMIALALLLLLAQAFVPGVATIRAIQVVMAIFLASGAAGVLLHYRGNVEWELERMASLSGLELFRLAIMGATPTLAPGTMAMLGLIGLLYTYRHPALHKEQQSTGITS